MRYSKRPSRSGNTAVTTYVPLGARNPRGGSYCTVCPILNLCQLIFALQGPAPSRADRVRGRYPMTLPASARGVLEGDTKVGPQQVTTKPPASERPVPRH